MPEITVGGRGARGVWATVDAGEMLEGVVATARRDARFDIELHLVAQWPFGSLFDAWRPNSRAGAARCRQRQA